MSENVTLQKISRIEFGIKYLLVKISGVRYLAKN